MPRSNRLHHWVMALALAAGTAVLGTPVSAQTEIGPPAARVLQVREPRCVPRRSCWFDHWGYRRCFRRWVCSGEVAPTYPDRRRYSLEDDYVPESRFRRDREPSFRRYRRWADPVAPDVVRPERRAAPVRPDRLDRQRVTIRPRPRLRDVPGRDPAAEPNEQPERPANADRLDPEVAARRDEPEAPKAEPERSPEVEIIPRPVPPKPEKESARLKEPPPVPARPRADSPAGINPAPLRPKAPANTSPDTAPDKRQVEKDSDTAPDKRQADTVPDEIDKLPRGRKIPMDEIEPPKPKKKLRERLPI